MGSTGPESLVPLSGTDGGGADGGLHTQAAWGRSPALPGGSRRRPGT